MESYKGHVCSVQCNKNYPISCWACLSLWHMECLYENGHKDIIAWVDNYRNVPGMMTFFTENACIRFICPLCLDRRMEEDPFGNAAAPGDMDKVFNQLKRNMTSMKTSIAKGNTDSNAKMDKILTFMESNDQCMVNFNGKIAEMEKNFAAKLERLPVLIETLIGNPEQHTNHGAPSKASNVAGANGGLPAKRPRSDSLGADISMDLSMCGSSTGAGAAVIESPMNLSVIAMNQSKDQGNPVALRILDRDKKEDSPQYTIHVSKFMPDETERNIVDYILQRSSIKDPNLFTVTKLFGKRPRPDQSKFVSFKITANGRSVYDCLMSPELWPNVTVRRFVQDGTTINRPADTKSKRNFEPKSGRKDHSNNRKEFVQRGAANSDRNRQVPMKFAQPHIGPPAQHPYHAGFPPQLVRNGGMHGSYYPSLENPNNFFRWAPPPMSYPMGQAVPMALGGESFQRM